MPFLGSERSQKVVAFFILVCKFCFGAKLTFSFIFASLLAKKKEIGSRYSREPIAYLALYLDTTIQVLGKVWEQN